MFGDSGYPQVDEALIDEELELGFELLIGAIRTIRNLRAELEIKPSMKIAVILQSQSDREREILQRAQPISKTWLKWIRSP